MSRHVWGSAQVTSIPNHGRRPTATMPPCHQVCLHALRSGSAPKTAESCQCVLHGSCFMSPGRKIFLGGLFAQGSIPRCVSTQTWAAGWYVFLQSTIIIALEMKIGIFKIEFSSIARERGNFTLQQARQTCKRRGAYFTELHKWNETMPPSATKLRNFFGSTIGNIQLHCIQFFVAKTKRCLIPRAVLKL